MTNEEIRRVAETVLMPTLGPHGFDHAEIRLEDDQSGEPAIYVEAHFREGSEPTPGEATLTAGGDLLRAFMKLGDPRFPYLEYRFDGDDTAEEDDFLED